MSRASFRAQVLALAGVAVLAAAAAPASATVSASANYAATDNGDGTFTYSMLLKNTGTVPIKTFWFAWLPGFAGYYDFLNSAPGSIGSPAGWSPQTENGYYGYSIDWSTAGAGLAPGASLGGFQFTSTDAPTYMTGNDGYFGYYPVTTSYVYGSTITLADSYAGQPFGAFQAAPGAVPEPASAAMALVAGLPVLAARRRQRRSA